MAFIDYEPSQPVAGNDFIRNLLRSRRKLGRIANWNELMNMGMQAPQPVSPSMPLGYGQTTNPIIDQQFGNAVSQLPAFTGGTGVQASRPLTDAPDIAAMGPQQPLSAPAASMFAGVPTVTQAFSSYQPKNQGIENALSRVPARNTTAVGALSKARPASGSSLKAPRAGNNYQKSVGTPKQASASNPFRGSGPPATKKRITGGVKAGR